MTRISNLASTSSVAQTDVLIISDGQLTQRISVADFKKNILAQATKDALGTIRVGTGLEINDAGLLSVKNYSAFTLAPATADVLGGIRVGPGLEISDTGVLSSISNTPVASETVLGGIKVGSGLLVSQDGVLSVESIDRTKFADTGIHVGTAEDIHIFVDGTTPAIREVRKGILDIGVFDENMTDGTSNIRFLSSTKSNALGGDLRAALVPDPEGESIDLGVPSYPWHSLYARNINGDLTGRHFGDSFGVHTGNILANDASLAYDSFAKVFRGNLVGNVTGNVDTASKLYIPRAINGVYFDGSSDITIRDDTRVAKSGSTMNGFLTLHLDPELPMHAATKQYADNRVNTRLPVFGGTMTGFLTLNDPPQQTLHAATKGYVDDQLYTRVAKTGSTMSGFLTLHADPTQEMHASTKDYVDNTVNAKADQLTTSLTAYINQQDNTKLPLAGGTMTGFIKLHSAPTDNTHASTKLYVDTGVQEAKDLANTKLPLAGGTLTGAINAAVGVTKGFRFSQIGTDDSASIYYYRSSGFLGLPTDNRHLVIQVGNDATDQIRLVAPDNNGVKINGFTVWHSGNDGVNSSLDADMLRGITPSVNRAVNTIVVRDSNNKIYADVSGNATTATTLASIRTINGVEFDGSANVSFFDNFSLNVKSPGPQTFPSNSIRGFDAYSSTDFPSNYFSGLTITGPGGVRSTQIAANWNAEEAAPTGLYFRVNDDTTTVSEWSSWKRIATASDIVSTSLDIDAKIADLNNTLKAYIDQRDDTRIPLAGGTMTGRLTLSADPVNLLHAATKQYVDTVAANIPRQNLTITRGASHTVSYSNIVGGWNDAANYFDVFPPSGKTMGNLLGFIPSIWYIAFAGAVNYDDSLKCTYTYMADRIRVNVQNTEQRDRPAASWLAIWS